MERAARDPGLRLTLEFLECLHGKLQKACIGSGLVPSDNTTPLTTSLHMQDGGSRGPSIMVGYSLGGLLIKQALVSAHANGRCAAIELSTYASEGCVSVVVDFVLNPRPTEKH